MSDDYARYTPERNAWDLRVKGWRELGASARLAHCLAGEEISDPRDPRLMDDRWLLRIPMFGRKSLRELRELIGRAEPLPRLEKSWQTVNPLICTFGEWRPGEEFRV